MNSAYLRIVSTLFALLTLATLPAFTRHASAQSAPLTLEVRAGFDAAGSYRVGHWFPVLALVTNEGPDLRASLEWRFAGSDAPTYRYAFDLPRGARKALSLPIITQESNRAALLSLQADGATLAESRVRLAPIEQDRIVIGVLSSNRPLLNSLAAVTLANGLATTVLPLDPAMLPDDASLLAGIEAIFIHDLATNQLSAARLAALELWTRQGGVLIVGGGPQASQTTPGLAAILPADVGALQADVSLAPLAALVGTSGVTDTLPATTVSLLTPRPGARSLDQSQLLVAGDLGAGQVICTAFDLAATRTWAGEVELWSGLLSLEPRVQLGTSFRWQNENLLRDTLNLSSLRLPSIGLLLLLMVGYILLVGPLNFLVLRRLRRLELAWITTPLLVLVALAATYGTSLVLRGTQPQLIQLTIVQGSEGRDQAQATAFVGLFSPQRQSYQLDLAAEALITPGSFEGWEFRSMPVTLDGLHASVPDLLVDVSSLRTLLVEQQIPTRPVVTSRLERQGNLLTGELELAGDLLLRDAILVSGADAQPLGDLSPGTVTNVALPSDQLNFPELLSLSEGGLIIRGRVLNSLFGYDRFAIGGAQFGGPSKGIPGTGVYLLGWAEQPSLEVQLDSFDLRPQGETLYIIRLGTGSQTGGIWRQ